MKKYKNSLIKLSLVAFLSTSANALSLEEAVNIALENNHTLQMKDYDYKVSQKNIELNNANYLPKLDLSYSYNQKDKILSSQEKKEASFSATISYNLFNGFKDISNKESSKYLSKSSKYSLEALKQDTILNTKKSYINYLDKKNLEKTYENEYKLFSRQYEDTQNMYNQGLVSKNNLLQVKVNMSNAKQNLVRAKANTNIAKLELSNILGGMDLSSDSIENLKEISISKSIANKNLLEKRSELQALKMNIESLKKQKSANDSSYYPKIDTSFSYNRYYEDLSFTNNESLGINSQNIAKLSATWNLYNGGKDSAQNSIYKIQISKLMSQLAKTKLDINIQYENAKADLEVSLDNFQTANISLEQAKENYKLVSIRFKEGLSSTSDLIEANTLLTSSNQRYNKAYFDKYIALATLERVFEKK